MNTSCSVENILNSRRCELFGIAAMCFRWIFNTVVLFSFLVTCSASASDFRDSDVYLGTPVIESFGESPQLLSIGIQDQNGALPIVVVAIRLRNQLILRRFDPNGRRIIRGDIILNNFPNWAMAAISKNARFVVFQTPDGLQLRRLRFQSRDQNLLQQTPIKQLSNRKATNGRAILRIKSICVTNSGELVAFSFEQGYLSLEGQVWNTDPKVPVARSVYGLMGGAAFGQENLPFLRRPPTTYSYLQFDQSETKLFGRRMNGECFVYEIRAVQLMRGPRVFRKLQQGYPARSAAMTPQADRYLLLRREQIDVLSPGAPIDLPTHQQIARIGTIQIDSRSNIPPRLYPSPDGKRVLVVNSNARRMNRLFDLRTGQQVGAKQFRRGFNRHAIWLNESHVAFVWIEDPGVHSVRIGQIGAYLPHHRSRLQLKIQVIHLP